MFSAPVWDTVVLVGAVVAAVGCAHLADPAVAVGALLAGVVLLKVRLARAEALRRAASTWRGTVGSKLNHVFCVVLVVVACSAGVGLFLR